MSNYYHFYVKILRYRVKIFEVKMHVIIFRHDHYLEEPYIFTIMKNTTLQKLTFYIEKICFELLKTPCEYV